MSDEALASAHPGSLSPRNIDTVRYRVVTACGPWQAGDVFSAWPQGEVFANVSGLGLGAVRNSELAEWEKGGRIVRLQNG